jgi:hypothetical protein
MTLSQYETQTRWAASDVRVCRSLVAPCCEREGPSTLLQLQLGELGSLFARIFFTVDAADVRRRNVAYRRLAAVT